MDGFHVECFTRRIDLYDLPVIVLMTGSVCCVSERVHHRDQAHPLRTRLRQRLLHVACDYASRTTSLQLAQYQEAAIRSAKLSTIGSSWLFMVSHQVSGNRI